MAVALVLRVEDDAVLLVDRLDHVAELGSQHALERSRLRTDDVHLEPALAQRGRRLEPDEARADHDDAPSPLRSRDQRSAVVERAQIVHVGQVCARHVEAHDARAGREQERIEGHTAAVGHRYRASLRIEGGDGRIEPDLDLLFLVEVGRAQRDPILRRLAGEEVLRQVRPVVRGRIVGAEHGDRAAVALAPQHLGCRVACRAAADDDDRLRRRCGCRPLLGRLPLRLLAHEDLAVGLLDLPARDRVQRRGSQRFARTQAEARVVPGAAHRVIDQ